jgi:hypothetical protein
MKDRRILVGCIAFVLLASMRAELAHNQVDSASAASRDTADSLVTTSESTNQNNLAQQLASPGLPELVPVWQRLDIPVLPSPRFGASLTVNPINKVGLLFGGYSSAEGELNDLWLTDGLGWIQFQTPHSPEPRVNASLAYDVEHQKGVLFGGFGAMMLLGDTWLFNGIDWIQQQPLVSPPPRSAASMTYDPERNVIILFGGLADTGEFEQAVNEMWIWDGETWQQQFPATLPPARWGAAMAYDHARRAVILFGGTGGGGFWEDTWLWNGAAWVEQHPEHHPAGRANFGMAYAEATQTVILWGGQTHLEVDPTETWAWDGQDWTLLPTLQAPPEALAYGAQLAYIPGLQTVMLYNALREKTVLPDGSFIYTESSDVWILTYRYLVYLPIIRDQ